MTKKVFLIHGWQGSPEEGWRPWLRDELQKRGYKVVVPAMPNPDYPKENEWVRHIDHLVKMLGGPNKDFYLVGHSLGCIAILRYLETLEDGQEIGGVILVAGFTEELEIKEFMNFFERPIQWDEIKKHCKKFVAIHSDDDPYVPLKYGYIFEEKLGAELIIQHGMKHFSGDDRITELPIALEVLLRISK